MLHNNALQTMINRLAPEQSVYLGCCILADDHDFASQFDEYVPFYDNGILSLLRVRNRFTSEMWLARSLSLRSCTKSDRENFDSQLRCWSSIYARGLIGLRRSYETPERLIMLFPLPSSPTLDSWVTGDHPRGMDERNAAVITRDVVGVLDSLRSIGIPHGAITPQHIYVERDSNMSSKILHAEALVFPFESLYAVNVPRYPVATSSCARLDSFNIADLIYYCLSGAHLPSVSDNDLVQIVSTVLRLTESPRLYCDANVLFPSALFAELSNDARDLIKALLDFSLDKNFESAQSSADAIVKFAGMLAVPWLLDPHRLSNVRSSINRKSLPKRRKQHRLQSRVLLREDSDAALDNRKPLPHVGVPPPPVQLRRLVFPPAE